jgi:phosphomevalonate kinase
MQRQFDASEQAAGAVLAGDASGLIRALQTQSAALMALGRASGAEIVTGAAEALAGAALSAGAAALPAGAGGGDITLWVSTNSAAPSMAGLQPLSVVLGANGVCRVEDDRARDSSARPR